MRALWIGVVSAMFAWMGSAWADPAARPRATWIPPKVATPAGTEAVRKLLFADELLRDHFDSSELGQGALEDARKSLLANRTAEAQKILNKASEEEKASPDWLLLSAWAYQRLDKLEDAKKMLRIATRPNKYESRNRLWACRALRALKEAPDPAIADELLGVVVEVPLELGLDSLAAYPDGTARYVNQSGALLLYDPWNDPLKESFAPKVTGLIAAARPLVKAVPLRDRTTPKAPTLTLLTCAGQRSIAIAELESTPLMSAATELLVAITALAPQEDPADTARRECEQGVSLACYTAGNFERETPAGYPAAAAHFEKACKGGVPGGCNNFALMLDNGMGVAVDKKRAAEFMKKACDLDELNACANLGSRYAFGNAGIPKDRKKARAYLDKACAGGLKEGCVPLPAE